MIYLEENDTTREASRITASMNKTLQKVAEFMGVPRRTLHRLLKKENTSFTQLL